jgi:hypothetical protein
MTMTMTMTRAGLVYFLHHPAQPSLSDPSIHQGIQAYLPACLPACLPASHPIPSHQTILSDRREMG